MIPRIHGEWTDAAVEAIEILVEEAEYIWEVPGFIHSVEVLVWRMEGALPGMADVEEIILVGSGRRQLAVLGRWDLAWFETDLEPEPLQAVIEREIYRRP